MKKILGLFFRLIVRMVLIVVFLPLLFAVEPFCKIRLGTMYSQRLGHLAANTDIFFRRRQLGRIQPRTYYLFFGYDYANHQLFEMYRRRASRNVTLFDSKWGTRLVFACRPILRHTRFWEKIETDYTEYNLYEKTTVQIEFTEEEEKRGRAILAEMGIGDDDWFVGFHARDGSYLRAWRPQYTDLWEKNDWRNNDIQAYFEAVEYIASRGGFAVRMGAAVDAPLPDTGNPKIIDYATNYRSDFMDVYLFANCRFFLGTGSGPAWVPTVFGVPVVVVDHVPYSHSRIRNDIIIPRPIVDHENGRTVPFFEAVRVGFYAKSATSGRRGEQNLHLFGWGHNDPEDILGACKDMIDHLEGRLPSEEAQELQRVYAEEYLSHLPDYHIAAKVGPRWAVKHKDLIDPDLGA